MNQVNLVQGDQPPHRGCHLRAVILREGKWFAAEQTARHVESLAPSRPMQVHTDNLPAIGCQCGEMLAIRRRGQEGEQNDLVLFCCFSQEVEVTNFRATGKWPAQFRHENEDAHTK